MKYIIKAKGKEVYFEDRVTGVVKFDSKESAEEVCDICNLGSSKGYTYEVVEVES